MVYYSFDYSDYTQGEQPMTDETFNLCRQVYKAFPSWPRTDMIYGKETGRDWCIMPLNFSVPKRNRIPLYTSDYLLERLPKTVDDGNCELMLSVGEDSCSVYYGQDSIAGLWCRYISHGSTPLIALLRLVLELKEEDLL